MTATVMLYLSSIIINLFLFVLHPEHPQKYNVSEFTPSNNSILSFKIIEKDMQETRWGV